MQRTGHALCTRTDGSTPDRNTSLQEQTSGSLLFVFRVLTTFQPSRSQACTTAPTWMNAQTSTKMSRDCTPVVARMVIMSVAIFRKNYMMSTHLAIRSHISGRAPPPQVSRRHTSVMGVACCHNKHDQGLEGRCKEVSS